MGACNDCYTDIINNYQVEERWRIIRLHAEIDIVIVTNVKEIRVGDRSASVQLPATRWYEQ